MASVQPVGKKEIEPRKIYINALFLAMPETGIATYAYELTKALDDLIRLGEIDHNQYSLELLSPQLNQPPTQYQFIPVHQVGKLNGWLWEQLDLPRYSQGHLLFNPCNTAPLLSQHVIAIHDLSVFTQSYYYPKIPRKLKQTFLSLLIKSAARVWVDSDSSREDVQKYTGVAPKKLHVLPPGSNHLSRVQPDSAIITKLGLGQKPFLIGVGKGLPQEILSFLHKAIASIPHRNYDFILLSEGIESIFPVIQASRNELKALLQNATAVVFPAHYDGYGLELLEAMYCGCPIICANTNYYRDICGRAALFFEPDSIKDLSHKISLIMADPFLQKQKGDEGILQADKRSWMDTARQAWDILKQSL